MVAKETVGTPDRVDTLAIFVPNPSYIRDLLPGAAEE